MLDSSSHKINHISLRHRANRCPSTPLGKQTAPMEHNKPHPRGPKNQPGTPEAAWPTMLMAHELDAYSEASMDRAASCRHTTSGPHALRHKCRREHKMRVCDNLLSNGCTCPRPTGFANSDHHIADKRETAAGALSVTAAQLDAQQLSPRDLARAVEVVGLRAPSVAVRRRSVRPPLPGHRAAD